MLPAVLTSPHNNWISEVFLGIVSLIAVLAVSFLESCPSPLGFRLIFSWSIPRFSLWFSSFREVAAINLRKLASWATLFCVLLFCFRLVFAVLLWLLLLLLLCVCGDPSSTKGVCIVLLTIRCAGVLFVPRACCILSNSKSVLEGVGKSERGSGIPCVWCDEWWTLFDRRWSQGRGVDGRGVDGKGVDGRGVWSPHKKKRGNPPHFVRFLWIGEKHLGRSPQSWVGWSQFASLNLAQYHHLHSHKLLDSHQQSGEKEEVTSPFPHFSCTLFLSSLCASPLSPDVTLLSPLSQQPRNRKREWNTAVYSHNKEASTKQRQNKISRLIYHQYPSPYIPNLFPTNEIIMEPIESQDVLTDIPLSPPPPVKQPKYQQIKAIWNHDCAPFLIGLCLPLVSLPAFQSMTHRRALAIFGSAVGCTIFAVIATIGWDILRRQVFNSSNDDSLALAAALIGYSIAILLVWRGIFIVKQLAKNQQMVTKDIELEEGLGHSNSPGPSL